MNHLTLCYSTHRPETLSLSARLMQDHELVILEEPRHDEFSGVLKGYISLHDHLLELDSGYPDFTLEQYTILRRLYKAGLDIRQTEPYLEHLLSLQYFLADDHNPDEIEENTVTHSVYTAEKNATGTLIDYYNAVRGDDFALVLESMNNFAKADAARFILRDTLRCEQLITHLDKNKIFVEAGSIHIALYSLLRQKLPRNWNITIHSIDQEIIHLLNLKGSVFSPGDELTIDYMLNRRVSKKRWQELCSRALIYSKIIPKDEALSDERTFPHTRVEVNTINVVNRLSMTDCSEIFKRLKPLSTDDAALAVREYARCKEN